MPDAPAAAEDTDGSDYDKKMAGVGAWRPDGPAFGGLTEKVWMPSGTPTCITEIIVEALQRCYSGEEATTSSAVLGRIWVSER